MCYRGYCRSLVVNSDERCAVTQDTFFAPRDKLVSPPASADKIER
jgi:hypothetical protein